MPYPDNFTPIRLYESTKKKHFQDRLKIVREQNQNCSRTIWEEFANNFLSVLWSDGRDWGDPSWYNSFCRSDFNNLIVLLVIESFVKKGNAGVL